MTITVNETCDSIRIESDNGLLAEKLDVGTPPEIIDLTLEVYSNCSETPVNTLMITNIVIPGAPILGSIHIETDTTDFITLVPANLVDSATSFDSDILFLKLISVNTQTNTTKTEQSCVILPCDGNCEVIDYLAANPTCVEVAVLHKAILDSANCPECSCENVCCLYNKLQEILNSQTTDYANCGCNSSTTVLAIY
jgi:hypothetical protein